MPAAPALPSPLLTAAQLFPGQTVAAIYGGLEPWLFGSAAPPAAGMPDLEMSHAVEVVERDPASGIERRLARVAVIAVEGAITKRCACWWADVAQLEEIDAALAAARDDSTVDAIVLHFHTPGGGVTGVPETAALIQAIDAEHKPVLGFTDTLCASAGLWLAASCRSFYAAPSARVGSIGTVAALADSSAAAEAAGVRLVVARSGRYKAMGMPGKPVTEDETTWLQAEVDRTAAEFVAHVRARRGEVPDDALQGQVFTGTAAVGLGLVDGLAADLAEFLRLALTPPAGADF